MTRHFATHAMRYHNPALAAAVAACALACASAHDPSDHPVSPDSGAPDTLYDSGTSDAPIDSHAPDTLADAGTPEASSETLIYDTGVMDNYFCLVLPPPDFWFGALVRFTPSQTPARLVGGSIHVSALGPDPNADPVLPIALYRYDGDDLVFVGQELVEVSQEGWNDFDLPELSANVLSGDFFLGPLIGADYGGFTAGPDSCVFPYFSGDGTCAHSDRSVVVATSDVELLPNLAEQNLCLGVRATVTYDE